MSPKNRNSPRDVIQSPFEWVGARVRLATTVLEPEPFHPEMILWLELPARLVVGSTLVYPNGPAVSFADTFLEATVKPLAGNPRRPHSVRVNSPALAAELAPCFGPGISIRVAPTPEIDALLADLMISLAGEEDDTSSYFGAGRLTEPEIARMFDAARALYAIAPWKKMFDTQTLRLDIPQCNMAGACVSVIGNRGESFGILIFPNLEAWERFGNKSRKFSRPGRRDLGTSFMSLEFDPEEMIPPRMRAEIDTHGWEVAGPLAYPRVLHRKRDGSEKALSRREFEIVTACAQSLATFYWRNEALLDPERDEEGEPISITITTGEDLGVRFTYPYDAYELFEPGEKTLLPSPLSPETAPNSLCYCGSGKKYRACHFRTDENIRLEAAHLQAVQDERSPVHAEEEKLFDRMLTWARPRFGKSLGAAARDFMHPATSQQLFLPWTVYGFEVEGHPIVSHFLNDPDVSLTDRERRLLEAQQRAWLSIWSVQETQPGVSLVLLDLLTGEKRQVHEFSASRTLVCHDAILTRVVAFEEGDVLVGMHPRPLPPREAAMVVEELRGDAKPPISPERLRSADLGRQLIRLWDVAVAQFDRQRIRPMELRNTDGDQIVYIVDRYEIVPAQRDEIARRLAKLEDVHGASEESNETAVYDVVRSGKGEDAEEGTLIATLSLTRSSLTLESNSTRRANDIRRQVENGCRALLGKHVREKAGQGELFKRARGMADSDVPPFEEPSPEIAAVLRQRKQHYYEKWLDESIPVLGGKTPRQAARLERDRDSLGLLLREMENREARLPEPERADFRPIRAQLGL